MKSAKGLAEAKAKADAEIAAEKAELEEAKRMLAQLQQEKESQEMRRQAWKHQFSWYKLI